MMAIRMTVAAFALILTLPPALATNVTTKAVKFEKGATSTTIRDTIRGDRSATYTIDAVSGQVMQLLFAPSNRSCNFNVWEPGAAEAVHIGSTSGNEFGNNLAVSGAYRIDVYLMRNAARRNETCRFQLSVELTGPPGGASSGVSDIVMRDACKGAAAPMYGVQPRNVTLRPKIEGASGGGYTLDGTVDKGAEGTKRLRCIFKPSRELDRVMAMTPDGE